MTGLIEEIRVRNVREFGAKGDGLTLDTAAVQKALDTGDIVYFPQGTYLVGTVYLRSGGGIELDMNATLLGSSELDDYNDNDFDPRNCYFPGEHVTGKHLVIGVDVHDVVLRGRGTINGNGEAFFDTSDIEDGAEARPHFRLPPPPFRPAQMVYFVGCSKVAIEGIYLTNAPYWNCLFHDCEKVEVRDIHVHGNRFVSNSDGIDIDCCRHVVVSGCDIDTGDDGITVRANQRPFGGRDVPSEDITVRDCRIRSAASGVRVGVGTGRVHDCRFEKLTIHDTNMGISICPSWFAGRCVGIEDVVFSDCSFTGVQPIHLIQCWNGVVGDPTVQPVRNILFRRFHGVGTMGSLLHGSIEPGFFDHIRMEEVTLELKAPSAAPLSHHWGPTKHGVLNVARLPDFDPSGFIGKSEERLPALVIAGE